MTNGNLEAFAISFAKLVQIQEQVDIQKQIDVDVFVKGNSALANAKGEADALGPNSHTETLALTTTNTVQGVGSASSSIAEFCVCGHSRLGLAHVSGVRELTGTGSGLKPLPVPTDWPRLYRTVT